MLRKLFLLFNHTLTELQVESARSSLEVEKIIEPPSELKALWRQIPPDITGISDYLKPVKQWLSENANISDYVLIQGDFGACFILVNLSLERGLIPVYSTTHREAVEEHISDGSVKIVHRFQHQIFRKYGV
jgi:hypothetical protein